MRLTTIIIIAATMQVSAKSYSQNITLNVKKATLQEVFGLIKEQTGYSFLWEQSLLEKMPRINESLKNADIEKAMNTCLRGLPLTFDIKDKIIYIKAKQATPPTSTILSAIAPIQNKIHGRVTDSTGKPIAGASVVIKGTHNGTLTNVSGEYALMAKPGDILLFSYIGYKNKEVTVNESDEINISLIAAITSLEDVVMVGYGSQKKINLTGAISTVSGKVLEDRPITNIGRGLQGQLPGLNITSSSGQPGKGTSFNIRGFTSINGGSPLILVDGVQTDINDLNPDDVATATVLKDAAASAVYGSRAAFGVILITTKSGKSGVPKISYGMNYATHKITNLPDVITDPGTVVDIKNAAYYSYYGVNDPDWGTATEVAYDHKRSADPSLPTAYVDPTNPTLYDYAGSTNWFNELYKPHNSSQTQNLSVTGGTDKITYYFSADYNNQGGVFRYNPDYYNRYNVRGKLDFKLTNWLHIYTNSAYNRTQYNYPTLWTSDWTTGDLYHSIGRANSLDVLKNPDGSWTSAGVYIGFLKDGGRGNTITNEIQNTIGFATSFFNDTWRIKGDYTFRSTNNYNQSYQVAIPYETGPGQQIYYAGHSNASAWADDNAYQAINVYSEYEKTFGKHYFKGMIGYNQESNNYDYFSAERDNLISDNIGYLDVATGATPSVAGNGYQWAVRGIFSRLNYIYDNKYLLELDGRYDGSSRFPPSQHYAFFPSASAGWRISEEPFFRGLKQVVNNLKLRASYGSLGNDQSLGNYSFIPTLGSKTISNILGGLQPIAVYPPNLVSPNLTWEKVYSKNLGLDITLFKRFNATLDVYQRDTKNMITQGFQLPSVLGASQPLENAADLRTKGWDLNLTYNNQFQLGNKPFTYSIHASVWDDQTVITRYNNPSKLWQVNAGVAPYYQGQHVGEIWGLTDLGIFQTDAAAQAAPDQSALMGYYNLNKAGELQYADRNHDGKIDLGDGTVGNPGDASVIGNTTPRYQFGGGGNFTWNNFDLSFFFQGVGKEDFWPQYSGYYWSMFWAPWENVNSTILNNTWTPQNPNALFPTLKGWRVEDAGVWKDLGVPQSRYIYSAAYIRLKNLTVGYSFNFASLKKIGIDRLHIYFSGEDLWESDHLPQGFDPEGLGGSWGPGKVYPFQRSYSFGINATF